MLVKYFKKKIENTYVLATKLILDIDQKINYAGFKNQVHNTSLTISNFRFFYQKIINIGFDNIIGRL